MQNLLTLTPVMNKAGLFQRSINSVFSYQRFPLAVELRDVSISFFGLALFKQGPEFVAGGLFLAEGLRTEECGKYQ